MFLKTLIAATLLAAIVPSVLGNPAQPNTGNNKLTKKPPRDGGGGGSATVQNNCKQDVHLWSIAQSDTKSQKISPGNTYSEGYRGNPNGGGVSIKLSPNDSQDKITQFEYTLQGDKVFYDISNVNGYPFKDGGLSLNAGGSCPSVNCASGKECSDVYNNPKDDKATHACSIDSSLHLVLCSGGGKKRTVGSPYVRRAEFE